MSKIQIDMNELMYEGFAPQYEGRLTLCDLRVDGRKPHDYPKILNHAKSCLIEMMDDIVEIGKTYRFRIKEEENIDCLTNDLVIEVEVDDDI